MRLWGEERWMEGAVGDQEEGATKRIAPELKGKEEYTRLFSSSLMYSRIRAVFKRMNEQWCIHARSTQLRLLQV
eukprot:4669122-Pleurochrysis_carterae.AAC.2